ncbi:DUF6113 family protein [Streptomyces odonnellii]|uniref:DUF6113 family protein n=1 Tax=Streptomyces odonnellii TaxID=1417980 RepID=UPI00062524ED|nr:DUF6113 family protein [Streptomyces odonnellii]
MSGGGKEPQQPPLGPHMTLPGPGRIAAYAGLAVLGALVALAGSLVQGGWFPGGLVLALLATVAVFLGGLRATGTQMGVGAPAAGWLIAAVLLSTGRPEGDAAFSAGVGPLIYLLGGMALAVMCATMSRLPQPGTESGRLGK